MVKITDIIDDKKARIVLWGLSAISIIFGILFMYFVFAAHVVTTSGGGLFYSINEDVGFVYNISINNSDGSQNANITQVNITLPSGFLFIPGGFNGTTVDGQFSNTTNVLNWSNYTYLVNGSSEIKYFWFNATAATPGNYNITITTTNGTSVLRSNISVAINDTTVPSLIGYGGITETDGVNLTRTNIMINVTATDNGVIDRITIRLYNSTRAQINSSNATASPLFVNFTGLADGVYYFNATINDTFGNQNTSIATRTVTIDTGAPAVTINLPAVAGANLSASSVNFNVTLNENGSCAYSLDAGVTNTTMQNNGNRDFNATNVSIADGTYTVRYYCNDTIGNWNRTASRVFGIDTTYPLISYGTGTENDGANISINSIYVNVSITETNFKNITFILRNNTGQVNSTTFTAITRTMNWTGLVNDNYTYNISIYDLAGNFNSTATRRIRVDTMAPSIDFAAPTAANGSILVNLPVNISVSDSGIGVGTVVIRVYNTSHTQITNSTNSSSVPSWYALFAGLNGTVYVNATVNDTIGNLNYTTTRTYILSATSFEYNGTAKDENGNRLNNTAVNISVRNQQWNTIGQVSTTTNASGWFNITVASNNQWFYESSLTHFNGSFVDFKSKSIPAFPSFVLQMLGGTTFYLTPAGTINITAVNSTGGRTTFQYQIKDTALGYAVAEDHQNYVNEVVVYVPKNRNYSIMIYPNQNMPVSFNWNNFTSTSSYSFPYNSKYNATTYTLTKQFNVTTGLPRVSGYISYAGISGWNEFTVVPYLLEPGNMVHAQYGTLPYNLSSANQLQSDIYNLTNGFYNISLPATAETSTILLFASARNGSQYIGGFRNVSLAYATYAAGGELNNFNFTSMVGLFGSAANISLDRVDGGNGINITTAKQTFRLVNASNFTLGNLSAHIEVSVDYSSLQAIEFTWMNGLAQTSAVSTFSLPLLNNTGIKEINIFASGGSGGEGDNREYSPKRVSLTASQVLTRNNITMTFFNPGDIEGAVAAGQISIGMYISNVTCDVPVPPTACILGDTQQEESMSDFNPMQAVIGGGKISFRMGVRNITVHYVNVDMLASGPPDALFDSAVNNRTSGNSFDAAVRFGSAGPTIYDYVLVSIPYVETAGIGLNDSAQVNASLPVYYDDNWNVIWNTTANGTNQGAFVANNSHYSGRQSEWGYLLNRTTCGTSVAGLNATNPCYIDTTNNKIWIRLPHFSGTGPSITGSAVAAAGTTTTTSSSSSSGSGATSGNWTNTFAQDKEEFSEVETYNKQFLAKQRVRLKVNNETHFIGVTEVTTTTATIEVSSSPQQAVLKAGEEKKFDVTSDGKYDLLVKLNKIVGKKADITITYIQETIAAAAEEEPSPTPTATTTPTATPSPTVSPTFGPLWFSTSWIWLVIAIIVIVVVAIGIIIYKKKK